ncbi:MAG: Calx-beta domain-containing protein [Trichloromonadaceae bacterium]
MTRRPTTLLQLFCLMLVTLSLVGMFGQSAQAADTIPPTVYLSKPLSGAVYTVAQTVAIAAVARDNVGVAKVEFYNGTKLIGTDTSSPYTASLPITAAANGVHYLTAKAFDAAGRTRVSTPVAISVRIAPPVAAVPGALEFSSAAYSVLEGAGKINVPINRVGGSAGAVSVQWRTRTFDGFGTADWASDYGTVSPARTLSFAAGETSKTISITINQDTLVEGDETFTVLLENAGGGATLGAKASAIVTIKDDDVAAVPAPTPTPVAGPLKVFPGAQGFGTQTRAGRGGQIIKVTNLNDSGTGSLRAALAASGARIIVFEVGGSINLSSSLNVSSPFVTIAGQTAPAPGIMLRGGGININTNDVLVQHLAIRPGANASDPLADGISINNSKGWNIVLDHLSLQWAPDEQISTWIAPRDITVSNCIIAEGMGEKHGMLIGDSTKNVTLMGNLFAHNGDRSPALKGDTSVVYANNVVYNPGGWEHTYFSDNGYNDRTGDGFSGPVLAAMVGNVFKDGPSSGKIYTGLGVAKVAPGSKVYQSNNARNNGPVFTTATASVQVTTSPINLAGYSIETNLSMVEFDVLASAGTRPAQRDAVDARIVKDVKAGTGSIPASQPAYPVYQSTVRAFQTPSDPHGDYDGNGYSNIEELLHQMAAQVEGK